MSTPTPTYGQIDDPKRPWKALVPIVLGVLYAVIEGAQIALGDGSWDRDDTIAVVMAAVTALGVYLTRNPKVNEGANGL